MQQALVQKMDLQVDLVAMQRDMHLVLERYPFQETAQIAFTHREGVRDPEAKVYDGTGRIDRDGKAYDEFDYNVLNEEFRETIFYRFLEQFQKDYTLGRARLMLCKSRHCYSFHRDTIEQRYHIALQTTPYAYMLYHEREMIHIPADGYVYQTNVSEMHSVMNGSRYDRIHFVYELKRK